MTKYKVNGGDKGEKGDEVISLEMGRDLLGNEMSRTRNLVTKINILLQEICDIKVQNQKKQHINDHRTRPMDIGGEHGQENKHS